MEETVERKSLVDQIYILILKKIQNRELVPGDRLNIEELAKTFSVSRTPVRETINRMIQEGFVEQKHNVGPSIVKLDGKQEQDLITANAYLFDVVIETYRQLESLDELVEKLEHMIEMQERALFSDREGEFYRAACEFHHAMIDCCPNKNIREYARKTQNQVNMCTFAYLIVEENRRESIACHRSIKDALKAGDIEKAKKLMDSHNRYAGIEYMAQRLMETR